MGLGAEAQVVCPQGVGVLPTLDVLSSLPSQAPPQLQEVNSSNLPISVSGSDLLSSLLSFVPTIRSGSCADIGPRRLMEDEHIRIDDLSLQLGSPFVCPMPSSFYGVFDGHGGPDAAAYVKKNVMKFFFEAVDFPQASEVNELFLEEVEDCLKKAFLLADVALAANDCGISNSSGTTALTALVLGRLLMVANAGDCRAVLCRKGEAIEMSRDHRPVCPSERRRVEEMGGYVDDGYLNGELSVTRALGDWHMKTVNPSSSSSSPLIAEPELRQIILTEDDEFLIIGCDGIWDVLSSQEAVSFVRRGLRRHDDPDRCAKDLVKESLRLNTSDNLTVIIICFTSSMLSPRQQHQRPRRVRCSISAEAIHNLKSLIADN